MTRRLVMMGEGPGEELALPTLTKRVLDLESGHDALFLHDPPLSKTNIAQLVKDDFSIWKKRLLRAKGMGNLGAVLLLLDGDEERNVLNAPFCAKTLAHRLAIEAKSIGGGASFSVAVVFALQEFESWLIAGIESLRGCSLANDRGIVPHEIQTPDGDLEVSPRQAKEWLQARMPYKQTLDQKVLAANVDLEVVHARMRSFRRFRGGIGQLVHAVRTGQHVSTPC